MYVTRVLDVLVLLLLAALVVIPRPNVTVKAALAVPPEQRERVAQLQAHLLGAPDDVETTIELADLFLDGKRPDWALATVGSVLPRHDTDYRLYLRRAVAYADRFEAPPAFAAVDRALALCDAPPAPGVPACEDAPRARLHLLHGTLERIKGIDMRHNPALAKDKIYEALHPVWLPKNRRGAGATTGSKGGAAAADGPAASPVVKGASAGAAKSPVPAPGP